ncbi:MAG: LysE family translocator [Phycisphaerales bacterium]
MPIELTTLLVFAGASLMLNLTPGPDLLYTLTRASSQGARAGIAAALGNFAGTLVQTTLIAIGLGALLAQSAVAFTTLRWVGAAYLASVGIRMILASSSASTPDAAARRERSFRRIAVEAFLIHTLNPKVVVFFLAFLPQFVDADRGSPTLQLVLLGLWFAVQASTVLTVLSLIAGRARRALAVRTGLGVWLRRVIGAVFVGLGGKLALTA